MSGQRKRSPTITYNLDTNPHELRFREEVLKTGEFSDVSFLVGDQTKRVFKAHRFILMAGSQLFRDMLTGQRGMQEIAIPRVNPNNFVQLLNVIYLNCFEIHSPKMAIGCLQLFQEHNLKNAVRMCHAYLARGKEPAKKPEPGPQPTKVPRVTEKPGPEATEGKAKRRRRYGKPRPQEQRFWRPTFLRKHDLRGEEERDTDELYRKVRGALNKLTEQNFDILSEEVKTLMIAKMNNRDRVIGCAELIVEKAISEPMYCSMYAKFCKPLALLYGADRGHTFGSKLKYYSLNKVYIYIDSEDSIFPSEGDQKTVVATMIFYGEVYKSLEDTGRMLFYINLLLDHSTNDSLECLCEFLVTIGKHLTCKVEPNSALKAKLDDSFKKLEELNHNASAIGLSNKTRFALMDVIELKNDQWEPRRKGMIKKIAERTQQIVIEPIVLEPEDDLVQQMDEIQITDETEIIEVQQVTEKPASESTEGQKVTEEPAPEVPKVIEKLAPESIEGQQGTEKHAPESTEM